MRVDIKKIFLVGILGLLLFHFTSAAGTETQATFIIGGCSTIDGDGNQITAPLDTCYTGSDKDADGKYYCTADGSFIDTMIPSNGCSLNKNILPNPSSSSCCPKGYYCTDEGSTAFECAQRTEPCSTYSSQKDCEDKECIWLKDSSKCVETVSDLSCGFYDNKEACEDDNLSLGRIGVGTDVIGSSVECGGAVYSISQEDSSCIWNDTYPDGKKCHLNYVAKESLGGSGSFQCSNVYTLGDCVDGKQAVTWSSTSDVIGGELSEVPEDCLTALGCSGGEDTRVCGEEPIKLPGFSLFSLIASISIIGIWYFAKSVRFK